MPLKYNTETSRGKKKPFPNHLPVLSARKHSMVSFLLMPEGDIELINIQNFGKDRIVIPYVNKNVKPR